jgi:hypothetical protein
MSIVTLAVFEKPDADALALVVPSCVSVVAPTFGLTVARAWVVVLAPEGKEKVMGPA